MHPKEKFSNLITIVEKLRKVIHKAARDDGAIKIADINGSQIIMLYFLGVNLINDKKPLQDFTYATRNSFGNTTYSITSLSRKGYVALSPGRENGLDGRTVVIEMTEKGKLAWKRIDSWMNIKAKGILKVFAETEVGGDIDPLIEDLELIEEFFSKDIP